MAVSRLEEFEQAEERLLELDPNSSFVNDVMMKMMKTMEIRR